MGELADADPESVASDARALDGMRVADLLVVCVAAHDPHGKFFAVFQVCFDDESLGVVPVGQCIGVSGKEELAGGPPGCAFGLGVADVAELDGQA